LVYEGRTYQLPRPGGEGKALRSGIEPRYIPIYLATLGPKSLELTGELADGWAGTTFMPEHADVFLGPLQAGAERAGRSLADLDLQASAIVDITDDVDRALTKRKSALAFQIGAMGSREHNFYKDSFARAGYAAEVDVVQDLWLTGRREDAAQAVPDDLVARANLIGTREMVSDRIRRYRNAGISTLSVNPAGATTAGRLDMLAQAIDLVRSVSNEPF
jgi:alkanesulfonate monooxygenase SsuD/methylene tetrahydromethanopterin reductase-like flavin-dependent oxidoreductase (luciferase family)